MDRREFLEGAAIAVGSLLFDDGLLRGAQRVPPMIGIQAGAISFVDEGTEQALENFQQLGAVDTVFLATFTYGRGIAGRMPRGTPLPDHGKQEYDDNFHGGNFATPHPQYYRGTTLRPEKAPDHPDYDVIADVLPAARKRRMKVICWFEDVFRDDVPGIKDAFEVDVHGRPATRVCYRNPNTRNFWLGLVEDHLRSYDVDGLMFGSERQGPLNAAIGASHGGDPSPGTVGCFCTHCLDAAKKASVDPDRARQGYLALEAWVNGLKDRKPTDGAFVTFWRLLTDYPEILGWERVWTEGLRETYRAIYAKAHEIAPAKPMGWHIWHTNSFAPFYRAEQDYQKFQDYSDFLKVVMYNNSGGPRMARYIRNVSRTVFADLDPETALKLSYSLLQYPNEAPLAEIPTRGLSSDYVIRETKRAAANAGPRMQIYPGIDVDIPTGVNEKKTTPDDVSAAVKGALEAGAHGVILSRKYSEMRLDNLRAAGRAVRDLAK
jgi:hypothetical protein